MDINRILHLTNNNELNNLDMIRKCIQTKPVIIFMVAPWCGHCQRLEPTIDALEKEMVDEPQFNKLHIIKIHDEYIPKVNLPNVDLDIDTYPTIRMLSNGKHISDLKGDRNSKSIKDFISNNLNISRNSRSLKPNKRNCRNSKKRKSIASRHSKPVDGDIFKTFKLRKGYKCKNNKGPGSKDPNWLKKTLNLKDGKKKGKKKSKKKNTKKKNTKKKNTKKNKKLKELSKK